MRARTSNCRSSHLLKQISKSDSASFPSLLIHSFFLVRLHHRFLVFKKKVFLHLNEADEAAALASIFFSFFPIPEEQVPPPPPRIGLRREQATGAHYLFSLQSLKLYLLSTLICYRFSVLFGFLIASTRRSFRVSFTVSPEKRLSVVALAHFQALCAVSPRRPHENIFFSYFSNSIIDWNVMTGRGERDTMKVQKSVT